MTENTDNIEITETLTSSTTSAIVAGVDATHSVTNSPNLLVDVRSNACSSQITNPNVIINTDTTPVNYASLLTNAAAPQQGITQLPEYQ